MMSFPARWRRTTRRAILGVAASLWMASLAAPALAAEDLDKEMGVVARGIKQLLDGRDQDAIAVGEFTGPARAQASGGAGIKLALIGQLQKLGVRTSRTAELEVKGDYLDVEDRSTKLLSLWLKARILDRSGNEVTHFDRGLFNVTTLATTLGVTATIPVDATDEDRNEKLADAIDSPRVHLAGTRISAGAGSPYAIEVLVRSGDDYRPRAASKDPDGYAFLKIRRDEVYEIRVVNDSPQDAAVTLTIDGVSVFAFSANTGYTHWIVPAGRSLTVPGWHRTNKVSDAFRVTEYARSAVAEKLPGSANVGTITAAFAAAWPQGSPPPGDEPKPRPGTRSADATGKGPPVDTGFVEYTREVGRLRDAISVRYTRDADPGDLPESRP